METREIKNEDVEQRNKLNEPWIPTEQELQVEKMVLPDSLPTPEPVKTDNTTNNENE